MTVFANSTSVAEWTDRHRGRYHGDYEAILARNRLSYRARPEEADQPLCRFSFNPTDKVIIDIGCGGGWHMADCLANGARSVYGVELNATLIEMATASFRELEIPPERYRFLCAATTDIHAELPTADVIYSIAAFMHMPYAEVLAYLRLISDKLSPTALAYLQFYQVEGRTSFHVIEPHRGVSIADEELDRALLDSGLIVKNKVYPRSSDMEPVWTYYVCGKAV